MHVLFACHNNTSSAQSVGRYVQSVQFWYFNLTLLLKVENMRGKNARYDSLLLVSRMPCHDLFSTLYSLHLLEMVASFRGLRNIGNT